jgi:hypothetical protein
MDSRDAFDAIQRALEADPRREMQASRYEAALFGNFVISFEEDGQSRSIVNDRGELMICAGPDGEGTCRTLLPSLAQADEQTVLRALGL